MEAHGAQQLVLQEAGRDAAVRVLIEVRGPSIY